jgi:CheY-like chemotaxis protein
MISSLKSGPHLVRWRSRKIAPSLPGYNGVADMKYQASSAQGSGASLVPLSGQGLRILVVEDHEDTAVSTALMLRLSGHEVQVAPDGQSALRRVEAMDPDVVLLDLALPGMDGWQVAREIRERATPKRPFLVALSGYGSQADRRRSQEVGIDLHWIKPIDPEQLQNLLQRFQTVIVP